MILKSNGLVVKVLDSQSWGPRLKTNGLIQGQFSLSFLWGLSSEYQELLGTERLKVNSLLVVAL